MSALKTRSDSLGLLSLPANCTPAMAAGKQHGSMRPRCSLAPLVNLPKG